MDETLWKTIANILYKDDPKLIQRLTQKIEDFIESFKGIYTNGNVGKYHWKIRVMKILKYKFKQIIRQGKTPIMTKYFGRSKVASQKPRFHGRFIKKNKISR